MTTLRLYLLKFVPPVATAKPEGRMDGSWWWSMLRAAKAAVAHAWKYQIVQV